MTTLGRHVYAQLRDQRSPGSVHRIFFGEPCRIGLFIGIDIGLPEQGRISIRCATSVGPRRLAVPVRALGRASLQTCCEREFPSTGQPRRQTLTCCWVCGRGAVCGQETGPRSFCQSASAPASSRLTHRPFGRYNDSHNRKRQKACPRVTSSPATRALQHPIISSEVAGVMMRAKQPDVPPTYGRTAP